ncbi:hypothetical protein D8I30_01885 [Brevundimonas naejangsanensis]|uniref:Uncharacterized protein n=1 Tax=Brevundimonas naejangsanensis TaxID=588932 RepID=A0A494RHU7_9CAUL|nr:hypothetical protein [Brevundimonas naejangsanensis]AYG94070.1 hypothetical protein D8I30_01885 [Brevundimonas naejangsanensis]
MTQLTTEQTAAFERSLSRLSPADRTRVEALKDPAARAAAEAAPHWDFGLPARTVDALLGAEANDDQRRGLIAAWALELPDRIAAERLPQPVLAGYPTYIDRLAAYLDSGAAYDPDFWAKDVRVALALSVPGSNTQMLDMSSPVGPGLVVRHMLGGRGPGPLIAWVQAGGWRSWLETHTEARDLSDFNEPGWERNWAAAAALLRTRPDLAGVIGSSWFFDPPLETISPRLTYLRTTPMNNGAFMVHQGGGHIHDERASASSPTRRAMIEKGEYSACSWLLCWPRKPLIAWAERRGLI